MRLRVALALAGVPSDTGHLRPSRQCNGTQRVVFLLRSSLFITSRKSEGLLTPCCGQIDAFGFSTVRAGPHNQTLRLQALETVANIALRIGQRRYQLQVVWCTV
jgi:hypothetical protein